MKLNRLHSITLTSLLALLLFTGCQDETDALPSEGRRTITLDLGIAMTRAEEDDQVVRGEANDLKIWLFDQDGNFLQYIPVEKPQFTGRDLQGNPVESVEREFDITGVTQLQFRVLLNTDNLTLKDAEGNALTLGENTTINEIDAATFQFGTPLPDADNKVPMYGTGGPIPITTSKDYHAEIPLTRAVGKLELFFTKESEDGYLAIDKVELAQVPDKGYLKAPETYNLTYEGTATLFNSDEGEVIQASLPESITTGYFSEHERDFQRIDLARDYLLENPNPKPEDDKWDDPDTGNTDYIYPYDPENPTNVAAQDTRYMMTIHYRTSESETTSKTQIVYLPRIERNVWNKIFARVKSEDGALTIQYKVLLWDEVTSSIGWEPEFKFGGNAPMAAWRIKDKKIDPDFRNATEGDEEATCCYVLYPRFGRSNDQSDHGTLVKSSSYAAFYFSLKEPDGAVWEAYLSNPDDFELSTGGEYDSDGDGTKDKHCVMTGIARNEPYQIQVGARNAWTEADGTVTDEKEGADSGWNELTEWGKEIQASGEQYDVHTDLYIRVSLDNGITWHNLPINRPDYSPSDKENQPYYLEKTYWRNNRRFAGGDDYIRIWQLKAVKDGDFVEMVNDLDDKWAIKAHWKGED